MYEYSYFDGNKLKNEDFDIYQNPEGCVILCAGNTFNIKYDNCKYLTFDGFVNFIDTSYLLNHYKKIKQLIKASDNLEINLKKILNCLLDSLLKLCINNNLIKNELL